MHPCKQCVEGSKECRVGPDSDKCVLCVKLERSCDLVFNDADWEKVEAELASLEEKTATATAEIAEASAKLTRLQKQRCLLQRRQRDLVSREFANIAELEEDERKQEEAALLETIGAPSSSAAAGLDFAMNDDLWAPGSFGGTGAT